MASKKENKVMGLADAVAMIKDRDILALQGMGTQISPMAAIREIIHQGRKNLTVAQLVSGIGTDWLIAAGCVKKVMFIIFNLDEFGMAHCFRRAVEAGKVEVEEYTEHQFLTRFQSAAKGTSFGVTRSGLGSDLVDSHPDVTKLIDCPFTGGKVIAVRALEPDVCIVHAHRADMYGNTQFFPRPIWTDVDVLPRAAKKVIVTTEEVVDNDAIRRDPEHTGIPYFKVDAVVEVPWGAHPCSLFPKYSFDRKFFEEYAAESRTAEGARKFLEKYVCSSKTQAEYLERAGGAETLLRIQKWS
jgi:glutaconate CoA-transferase subunit A